MVEDQSTDLSPTRPLDLKALNSFNIYTNTQHNLWWSTLAGKHPVAAASSSGTGDADLSVFPPSSHENLVPAELLPSPLPTPYPPAPLRESGPDPGGDSGVVRVEQRRWAASARVLWCGVWRFWASFRWNWTVGRVGTAAAAVVGWWLWVRWGRRRRWRREENVGRLLRIIRDKDERISQLLNQIAQMNEVLLARHHRSLNVKS